MKLFILGLNLFFGLRPLLAQIDYGQIDFKATCRIRVTSDYLYDEYINGQWRHGLAYMPCADAFPSVGYFRAGIFTMRTEWTQFNRKDGLFSVERLLRATICFNTSKEAFDAAKSLLQQYINNDVCPPSEGLSKKPL